jgi:hypothetical protein
MDKFHLYQRSNLKSRLPGYNPGQFREAGREYYPVQGQTPINLAQTGLNLNLFLNVGM